MLFLPELVPRNVQPGVGEIDEELLLIQQEAQLKLEVPCAVSRGWTLQVSTASTLKSQSSAALQADSIRDYMRETAPIGAALTTTSVEEPTPEEEEEEEEEEDEGEDEDDGTMTTSLANHIHLTV